MKCRRCQYENPVEMNFCGECGARLTASCSACGASNPVGPVQIHVGRQRVIVGLELAKSLVDQATLAETPVGEEEDSAPLQKLVAKQGQLGLPVGKIIAGDDGARGEGIVGQGPARHVAPMRVAVLRVAQTVPQDARLEQRPQAPRYARWTRASASSASRGPSSTTRPVSST